MIILQKNETKYNKFFFLLFQLPVKTILMNVIKKQKIVLTFIIESGVIVKRDIDVTVAPVKVRNLHNYVKRLVRLHRPNYRNLRTIGRWG